MITRLTIIGCIGGLGFGCSLNNETPPDNELGELGHDSDLVIDAVDDILFYPETGLGLVPHQASLSLDSEEKTSGLGSMRIDIGRGIEGWDNEDATFYVSRSFEQRPDARGYNFIKFSYFIDDPSKMPSSEFWVTSGSWSTSSSWCWNFTSKDIQAGWNSIVIDIKKDLDLERFNCGGLRSLENFYGIEYLEIQHALQLGAADELTIRLDDIRLSQYRD